MKKVSCFEMSAVLVMVVILVSTEVRVSQAVTCNPLELSPCLGAIRSPSTQPSTLCCTKVTKQKPCLCGYLKDPNLRSYVSTSGAQRVADACKVPFPKC